MVERVEELAPQLCADSFCNRERLRDIEVEVDVAWSPDDADTRIAENSIRNEADGARCCRRRHESRGIEPAVDGPLVRWKISGGEAIGPAAALAANVGDLRLIHRQG